MNPNLDKVPLTVLEAIEMFYNMLDDKSKEYLKKAKKNTDEYFFNDGKKSVIFDNYDQGYWHFQGGMSLRNDWSLWEKDMPLTNDFKRIGITHPDDMSAIIFESVVRKIKGEAIDLEGQVMKYQDFWMESMGTKTPG